MIAFYGAQADLKYSSLHFEPVISNMKMHQNPVAMQIHLQISYPLQKKMNLISNN